MKFHSCSLPVMSNQKGSWGNMPNRHPEVWKPCESTAARALDIMYSGITPALCPPALEEILSMTEEMVGFSRGNCPEPANKRVCYGSEEICLCPGPCRVHYQQNMTQLELDKQTKLDSKEIQHGQLVEHFAASRLEEVAQAQYLAVLQGAASLEDGARSSNSSGVPTPSATGLPVEDPTEEEDKFMLAACEAVEGQLAQQASSVNQPAPAVQVPVPSETLVVARQYLDWISLCPRIEAAIHDPHWEDKLFNMLSPKTKRLMSHEPEDFRTNMLELLSCLKPAHHDLDGSVQQIMAIHRRIERHARSNLAFAKTPGGGKKALHYVIVQGCSGLSTGLMAVKWSFEILQARYPHIIHKVLEAWCYEINGNAIKCADLVHRSIGWDIVIKGNIDHFYDDSIELLEYPVGSFKVILLGSTECNNISFARAHTTHPVGTSGLHAELSRTWFAWYKGCKRTMELVGHNNCIAMHELPMCRDTVDETTLNKSVGSPVIADAANWDDAARNRRFRTSPILADRPVTPELTNIHRRPDGCMGDGTRWHCSEEARRRGDKGPTVLRRYWPRLLLNANVPHLKANFTDYEKKTLDLNRYTDLKGNIMNAGVNFYIDQLSLYFTPLKRIPEQIYKCYLWVDKHGGICLKGDNKMRCGESILCHPCAAAVQLLGGAWHLPSVTEVLARLLLTAVPGWVHEVTDESHRPHFRSYDEPAHDCGPYCPHNPDRIPAVGTTTA